MEILTVAQMREVERIADEHGLSYARMMRNAGNTAAEMILQRLDRLGLREKARILVLVGAGNNGGDGLVCATALAEVGVTTQAYLLKPRGDDDPVFVVARDHGIFIADATNDMRFRVLHQMATHATVIVDALLGTGTSRPIEGDLRAILSEVALRRQGDVETSRQRDHPVTQSPSLLVALDGVTGMNYDTGALDPAAVPADLTITFHAPKRGHYCFPAAEACGELIVAAIGVEQLEIGDSVSNLQSPISNLSLADDAMIRALLPSRKLDANKGTFGKALVIGGNSDYIGAPTLTARAAYRVGAGLVALAVPAAVKPVAAMTCSEATFVSLSNAVSAHAPDSVAPLAAWLSTLKDGASIALGPGIGQANETAEFLNQFLKEATAQRFNFKGLLCDADALNIISKMPDWHTHLPPNTILTPHAGEMARLANTTIPEIQGDRIGNALRYAKAWGHIVVLKGAYTIVAAPNDQAAVLPFSNPAMATAGTGDVLAGCIVGMLAQGLAPFDAAVCGAYLHGDAGEQWRALHGDAGMLASDLLALLPDIIRNLK